MQQAAYDYDYAPRKRARPQPERKKGLRVVRGGKRRLNPIQAAISHVAPILALGLLVGLAISLLQSEVAITELTTEIQKAKATLVTEQSEYTYYTSTLNSKASIANVEETASRLGLMKLDDSQITYIRLDDSSVLVRRESVVRQWTDFLHASALSIMDAAG